MTVTWVDGFIADEPSPSPSPLDPGLLVGDGLFETLAVYGGVPFALTEHVERLESSMAALGFESLDRKHVSEGIAAVVARAGDSITGVGRLRITVWRTGRALGGGGSSPMSMSVTLSAGSGPALGLVNTSEATVLTSRFVRNERSALTGHKSTSYAENAYALREAVAVGATEALLFNTSGDVAEGTMTNVVVDLGDGLVTPALSSGCLPGVTRRLVLDWAAEAGLALREAEPGELTRGIVGKPIALLGTLRNVQQVSRWDGINLPHSEALLELARVFAGNMHHALRA
ncbi:aminotransferase class IV [Populibacterium corticicola]|uniref:Aminotransferase class IV n=1 Tax=Populibacterium corticicola TaxID=1812826 RepID=A0ABW5XAS5_9MICO